MKAYPNMSLDYILHKLSYANLIMYSRVIPSYNPGKKKEGVSPLSVEGKKTGLSGNQLFTIMKGLRNG